MWPQCYATTHVMPSGRLGPLAFPSPHPLHPACSECKCHHLNEVKVIIDQQQLGFRAGGGEAGGRGKYTPQCHSSGGLTAAAKVRNMISKSQGAQHFHRFH